MRTTLNAIRACSPCELGWVKLLKHLGKTQADDEPLDLVTILESNGIDDALWCLRAVKGGNQEMRLFAVECAEQVKHLMKDERSLNALEVARRHANGEATDAELAAALAAAEAAARVAAGDAAWDAARAAAGDAAWDAASAAAWAASRAAARAAASAAAWASAWDAAWAAAWDAASAAARDKQSKLFRKHFGPQEGGRK